MRAFLLPLLLLGSAACDAQAPAGRGQPQRIAAIEAPALPALTGRVVDRADLLTPEQEDRLDRKSAALEREIGPQFVVVTVPSLGGRDIVEYGVDLGRHWGIGHKGKDDGLLLIVAPSERLVRIEVGYGLERRVTDPFAGKVIEQALPSFKAGRYPEGIEAASDALITRLRSQASDAEIARLDGVIA